MKSNVYLKEQSELANAFGIPGGMNEELIIPYYRKALEDYLHDTYETIPGEYRVASKALMDLEFFYPLVTENQLSNLFDFLALPHSEASRMEFPVSSEADHRISVTLESGFQRAIFLTRFLEQNFGFRTDPFQKSRSAFQGFHSDYSPVIGEKFTHLSKDEFYRYYDLFASYIEVLKQPLDVLFVLYPRKNLKLESSFQRFQTILNSKLQYQYDASRVRKVYWEDLADYVKKRIPRDCVNLRYQLDAFIAKYLA